MENNQPDRFRRARQQTNEAMAAQRAAKQAKDREAERLLDSKRDTIVGYLDRIFDAIEHESDAFGTGRGRASRTQTMITPGVHIIRASTVTYTRNGPPDGFELELQVMIEQHPQNPNVLKNGPMKIAAYPTNQPGNKSHGTFQCSDIASPDASQSDISEFSMLLEHLAAG